MESLCDGVITINSKGVVHRRQPGRPAAAAGGDGRLQDPRRPGLRHEITPAQGRAPARRLEREELRSAEGGTVLAITGSPMGTPEGGAVLSVRDVSERARLERMKDEFVLTASHELRSPLTSVQGFAELLMLEKDQLSEKHSETVEIILDNTRHLVAASQRPARPRPQRRRAG